MIFHEQGVFNKAKVKLAEANTFMQKYKGIDSLDSTSFLISICECINNGAMGNKELAKKQFLKIKNRLLATNSKTFLKRCQEHLN